MFSPEQLQEMSRSVDQQLVAARVMPIAVEKDAMDELRQLRSQLVVQQQAIEVATQEPADSFLRYVSPSHPPRK